MKLDLNSQRIEFPCPHCGRKNSETIGRLQGNPHLSCSGCGKGFDVDAAGLKKGIKSAQDALTKFSRDVGKLFK